MADWGVLGHLGSDRDTPLIRWSTTLADEVARRVRMGSLPGATAPAERKSLTAGVQEAVEMALAAPARQPNCRTAGTHEGASAAAGTNERRLSGLRNGSDGQGKGSHEHGKQWADHLAPVSAQKPEPFTLAEISGPPGVCQPRRGARHRTPSIPVPCQERSGDGAHDEERRGMSGEDALRNPR